MQTYGRHIALAAVGIVLAGGLLIQGIRTYDEMTDIEAELAASARHEDRGGPSRYGWGTEEEREARRQALAQYMHDQGWIDLDEVVDLREAVRDQMRDPERRELARQFIINWYDREEPADPPAVIEARGVQVGQTLPSLVVHDVIGEPLPLEGELGDKLTLLVTGSITSPDARRTLARLPGLARTLGDGLQVVVLYTKEADPYEPRPWHNERFGYRGGFGGDTDDGDPMEEAHRYRREAPETIGQRIELALELQEVTGLEDPPLVDPMDDTAWTALGEGPNVALLLDAKGVVLAKQGQFRVGMMQNEIEKHLR